MKNWFQNSPFKCNLQRYSMERVMTNCDMWANHVRYMREYWHTLVGLYKLESS